MTSHTGTSPQPFGYAGQQQDVGAEGGLVYLRAREYDPAVGRFVTQDRTLVADRYGYADDDPINELDASGLCGGSFDPRDYTDCPAKGVQRAIDYVKDPENRIGLEKSAMSVLIGAGCASPETGIGIGACALGLIGYYIAVKTQQEAICAKYNRGDYSANKAYAHNVLSWAPIPGNVITHTCVVGPAVERALETSPDNLRFPGATCGKKQHLS